MFAGAHRRANLWFNYRWIVFPFAEKIVNTTVQPARKVEIKQNRNSNMQLRVRQTHALAARNKLLENDFFSSVTILCMLISTFLVANDLAAKNFRTSYIVFPRALLARFILRYENAWARVMCRISIHLYVCTFKLVSFFLSCCCCCCTGSMVMNRNFLIQLRYS